MELLQSLMDSNLWEAYLAYKSSHFHLTRWEEQELRALMDQKGYLPVCQRILTGEPFPHPKKSLIQKHASQKKRVVYTYPRAENWVLKVLSWQLHRRYDRLFAPNLFSFRPGSGVKQAIRRVTSVSGLHRMHSYKADISNYFNTVPIQPMRRLLEEHLGETPETCAFLISLLEDPCVWEGGALVREEKGIMAGTPISTFLADLYLSQMDWDFHRRGIAYARYSDDMILFAPSQPELMAHISALHGALAGAGLTLNPEKEEQRAPGEGWTFLGVRYRAGQIDISPVSAEKLKGKMRRKTRALRRWQSRRGATGPQAARAFIRTFNRKLFENRGENDLTWARWYFPLITTTDTLSEIDHYCQSCIRYLASGKRTKGAYSFRYGEMKALGYETLVNRYYAFRKEGEDPQKGEHYEH